MMMIGHRYRYVGLSAVIFVGPEKSAFRQVRARRANGKAKQGWQPKLRKSSHPLQCIFEGMRERAK
jgi:hypothetical protein